MAKRERKEDPPAGSPAWMATFSDLMNLLLCFFVLLFSMSSVDAGKYAELVQSLSSSFNSSFSIFESTKGETIVQEELFPSSVKQIKELEDIEKDTGEPQAEKNNPGDADFDAEKYIEDMNKELALKLYDEISKYAESAKLDQSVEVVMDQQYQYVKLSLSGAVLFDSGQSKIKQESIKILSRIGDILKNYEDNIINIEGHTDNEPVRSGKYEDNMELSTDRAYQVWKYMVSSKHLNPKSLKSAGRSEYEPIASNATAQGRAKNRRVEFKIYTESSKKK